MTTTTTAPPVALPAARTPGRTARTRGRAARTRGRILARARRELVHLLTLVVAAVLAVLAAGWLRQLAPVHVWWPVLLGGAVYVSCLCRAPEGSSGVLTAARYAAGHPLQAAAVVAVVCLPWLGEWALAAIRAGTEAAVRAALSGMNLPSVPSVPSVSGLSSHLPSWLGGHR